MSEHDNREPWRCAGIVGWLRGHKFTPYAGSYHPFDHCVRPRDRVVSDRVDTEALEPMLLSGMRKRPTGDVRHSPVDAGALGTSTKGFLAELDRWLAARDARVRADERGQVAADVWAAVHALPSDADVHVTVRAKDLFTALRTALPAASSVGSGVGEVTP